MANVIKPSPPICIITIMTHSPNTESVVPILITLKPVTVVADAAVKKASIQEISTFVEIGSFKSTVPKRMTSANPSART